MKDKKVAGRASTLGSVAIGSCDVLKWDDIVEVNDHKISLAKAVNLGKEKWIEIAEKMEEDLKGEGLFIMFPVSLLLSKLQETLEAEGVPHEDAGAHLVSLIGA